MTFNKNGIDKVLSSTDRLEVIMRSRPSCVSTFVLSLTTSNSESHKSNRLCVTVESLQHSHSTDRIHRFWRFQRLQGLLFYSSTVPNEEWPRRCGESNWSALDAGGRYYFGKEADILSYTLEQKMWLLVPASRPRDLYLGRPSSQRQHPPTSRSGESIWSRYGANITLGWVRH